MYYPVGWPKKLNFRTRRRSVVKKPSSTVVNGVASTNGAVNGNSFTDDEPEEAEKNPSFAEDDRIIQVVANTDRSLFVVLTERSVHIWYCRPSVEIVSHVRDDNSTTSLGYNLCVNWRPDSTMLVIKTSLDMLLFYKVAIKSVEDLVFEQSDVNVPGLKRESAELIIPDKIPSFYLLLSYSTAISTGISSIMAAEEEVVVATKGGEIIGVNWDGTLDNGFKWEMGENSDPNIVDIKYSSMIGGFALVFLNGKVAFMPMHSQSQEGSTQTSNTKYTASREQFVLGIDNGVTSAINHKYQIIAFGLKSSEGVLCCIDEENSTVHVTHRIVLPSNRFPGVASTIGAMSCLQWSPDSSVLATSWEKGGIALWSVFGALLMCSLSWDFGAVDNFKAKLFLVSSMAWGKEGYQLWTVSQEKTEKGTRDVLMQMSMTKSILASNPSSISCCGELLVLVSEDRLYLGVGVSSEAQPLFDEVKGTEDGEDMPSTNATSSRMRWKQQPVEVGNHQWIVIQIPNSYLASNWPVRLAAVDRSGQHVAIAGRTGTAHYSLLSRKWKLFGNETQERDFEVCGGLLWWENFIVLSCFNVVDLRFEIRAYPHNTRLDNQFVRVVKVPAEVLVMSMHENRLLALLLDGSMHLFGFYQRKQSSSSVSSNASPSLHLVLLNQIIVSNLVVPPECVTSILLTSLHYETAKPSHESTESILMNVCGRLFFLERESHVAPNTAPGNQITASSSNDQETSAALVYKAVSILASGVENVWVSQATDNAGRPHLADALWLSRGCHGMNVWLPLLPSETERSFPLSSAHNFMSKRIMLPINTHIYPLAVLFRDAVVIGAENDTMFFGKSCPVTLPYSVISRTSQVYLHHILRELLKRNLGIHAWEIANSCSSLPYFPHSLELLLHETLEEEATSSQPIPDALLPRVIDFIREFPVFLETVVHCARKTELALWPHLFAVVGNPKELFQRCLDDNQLETAASYLLVLQNLERTSVSRKYATLLLDAAQKSSSRKLATDLARFLQAIDPVDFESPPIKAPTAATPNTSHPHSMKYVVSPAAVVTDIDPHHQQLQFGRKRTVSSSSTLMLHNSAPTSPDAGTANRSLSMSATNPAPVENHSSTNGHGPLIRSPSISVTTAKSNLANGTAEKRLSLPGGTATTNDYGDNDPESASQCVVS